jgi:YVTN family beta-propeller protein
MRPTPLLSLAALLLAAPALAQHAQTSAVAVDPGDPRVVWATNRDNDSVARVDTVAGLTTDEIVVGVRPRTIAFSPDGSRAFVANMRGDVPVDVNFLTPFSGNEVRGSVSVIDTASRTVVQTLTDVGVEPYGVAVAPNGAYLAVSAIRSGTIRFYDLATLALVAEHAYPADMDVIAAPLTIADVDADRDGIPDLADPRGFVIRSDSQRLYVTHHRSSFVSVLDVQLDPSTGLPTAVSLATKIDTNEYPFHPLWNPTPVREVKSQGVPRFLEDIALSPDGTRALVPHVLHNVNHDVNFDFTSVLADFPGDYSNRTYPALTVIDAAADSYDPGSDASRRLHNELEDPLRPAAYVPFGRPGSLLGDLVLLGSKGSPTLGGTLELVVEGVPPGHSAQVVIGPRTEQPAGSLGSFYTKPRFVYPLAPGGVFTRAIPAAASLEGQSQAIQVRVFDGAGTLVGLSNGLEVHLSAAARGLNRMGQRAGHPARVVYNPAGDRVLMLNRGSEDLFLYSAAGSDLELLDVFPPRHGFVERAPLDTTTALGDLPLGLAIVDDATTGNDDALVYVVNELTRTLSVLRVGWTTGVIVQEGDQIPTVLGPDLFTLSERLGEELLEDASRGQTTGAPGTIGEFNNSCYSCHFEGGEDANVWQRPAGPRSTMPFYDGTLMTGLMLWKGVRLHMGETGPMFGGENGGTGILSDAEQQALIDAHERIPVPLNPHLDPLTGGLTPLAQLGEDLFFGTNNTGLNPDLRRAGCAECHPRQDAVTLAPRGFTADFLDPDLTSGDNLQRKDPFCFSLQGNLINTNLRNVNSGVDVDQDGDGQPDADRNADGYPDVETYTPMNTDKNDDFVRDDVNSYLCPIDPNNPNSPQKKFLRSMRDFSIPTKLGVFSSSPYFHDHSAYSLRMVVDPAAQAIDPVYGSPAFPGQAPYPGLNKFFNEFHDVRGHEQFVQGASKVQLNLQSTNVDADIEAILAFIRSL